MATLGEEEEGEGRIMVRLTYTKKSRKGQGDKRRVFKVIVKKKNNLMSHSLKETTTILNKNIWKTQESSCQMYIKASVEFP